jgi:hypothetical protein
LGGLVDMFESSIEGREDIYYYGPRSLQYNASSYCEDIKSAPPPIKNYFCTKCSEAFYSAEGLAQHYLQEHYSLENPLSAPSLFVKGHPLPVKTTIRSRLSERDITVFHCDKYEVDKNGSGWHNFSEEEFKKLILTETDSTMMIRLTRFRRVDDSSSFSEYHLYFRIPQSTVLDGIDKAFFKYLVKKNLTHSDLSNFYSARAGPLMVTGIVITADSKEFPLNELDVASFLRKPRRSATTSEASFFIPPTDML